MSAIQAAVFNSGQNVIYVPGMVRGRYSGYAGSNTAWFDTRTPVSTSIISSPVTFSSSGDFNVSFLWRGYYRPSISGSVTFSTSLSSNDASTYHALWLGSSAQSGYNLSNALLSGGGSRTGSLVLTAGIYYPMRIQLAYSGDGGTFDDPFLAFSLSINSSPSYQLFYNSLTQGF